MTMSPFDHEPDPELGRMLREALTGPEPEAFLQRLRMAAAGAERGDQWDVLAGWARPRVLAMTVAAGFLLWLGAWFGQSAPPADAGLTMASMPAQAVVSSQPPDVDEIMSALRERP
jgi:hypothetical protein